MLLFDNIKLSIKCLQILINLGIKLHNMKLKIQRSLIGYHSTDEINSQKRTPALKSKLDPLR